MSYSPVKVRRTFFGRSATLIANVKWPIGTHGENENNEKIKTVSSANGDKNRKRKTPDQEKMNDVVRDRQTAMAMTRSADDTGRSTDVNWSRGAGK